jgi:putative oxidoreductase
MQRRRRAVVWRRPDVARGAVAERARNSYTGWMAPVRTSPAGLQGYALSLLRLMTGFLFAAHGAQKLLGLLGGFGGSGHTAPFGTLFWLAGVLELGGGLLILTGLFTRPVAFVLCGEMAVAYFKAHARASFWPILNHGELAALYCFVFLFLATAGGGPWSLDRVLRRK